MKNWAIPLSSFVGWFVCSTNLAVKKKDLPAGMKNLFHENFQRFVLLFNQQHFGARSTLPAEP